jgi:hypothetical protein
MSDVTVTQCDNRAMLALVAGNTNCAVGFPVNINVYTANCRYFREKKNAYFEELLETCIL